MSHARTLAALALAVAALTGRTAGAQAATTAFHAGQNAIEANVTSGASGIAFMHFTSPTAAILVGIDGQLTRDKSSGSQFQGDDETHGGGYAALSLGLRHLRPITSSAAALIDVGVDASYTHFAGDNVPYYGLGLFGRVGGQYSFAPNLSAGVSTGLSASYQHATYGENSSASRIGVFFSNTRAGLTFYF